MSDNGRQTTKAGGPVAPLTFFGPWLQRPG